MSPSQSNFENFWNLPHFNSNELNVERLFTKISIFKILLFYNSSCRVFCSLRGRLVEYSDGSQVLHRRNQNCWKFQIFAVNEERWLELAKLANLSVYGIFQEHKNKLRIHAAAIRKGNLAHIYWGKPGAGKTTLAKRYIGSSRRTVLTDELSLFDGKFIEGVNLKLHVKNPPQLLDLPPTSSEPIKLGYFFVLTDQRGDRLRFRKLKFYSKIKVAIHLIIGTGLHQMAAYHLGISNLFLWVRILTSRVKYIKVLFKNFHWIELSLPERGQSIRYR